MRRLFDAVEVRRWKLCGLPGNSRRVSRKVREADYEGLPSPAAHVYDMKLRSPVAASWEMPAKLTADALSDAKC